ncbi:sigma 54-interacting transcriptional regulator [Geobacter sulfurreducens]|uniref:sigma 54-interacting transcriptional regulator n=1 Tax=Geobacter sulfurreducens TaxID=35554 RepID=UPI002C68631B|nr:sigma 54-interacting transcriptional regulator [Geobacter sulfurreducens]HML76857.1 sigma 54-interacting transcriptional regulator [Geobacter sulfurreducens]
MTRLTAILHSEREFFSRVARAAFLNPFSESRDELDQSLAGNDVDRKGALDAAIARVADRSAALREALSGSLTRVPVSERETIRTVLLFDLYHRFLDDFDRLIRDQAAAGDTPCPVPFAGKFQAAFDEAGFPGGESRRYLALFYQIRRAFYFIREGLAGSSPSLRRVREHLWQTLFTHNIRWFEQHLWDRMEDFSVLILGETGTGKGTAAAAIGRSGFIPFDPGTGRFSESFTRNFLAVNLSQYPEGILESELFGHRKGAFTGAIDHHEGVFSRCTPHGAIFLDEIGEVSLPAQVKLLQVVQDRTFSPVGSHQRLRFSGRLIAATNRDLTRLRQEGAFRDDFYYRLCSDVITIPPLRQRVRERPEELTELIAGILRRLAGAAPDKEVQVLRRAIERDVGKEYHWPGNVRELEQAVRRMLVTGHYRGEAKPEPAGDLARYLNEAAGMECNAQELLAGYCRLLYERHGTFEEVARRANLDRRTVKKYLQREQCARGDSRGRP